MRTTKIRIKHKRRINDNIQKISMTTNTSVTPTTMEVITLVIQVVMLTMVLFFIEITKW